MRCLVRFEKKNIAPPFQRAYHKMKYVDYVYPSVANARRFHNLKKCDYRVLNKEGEVIRCVNNCYKYM